MYSVDSDDSPETDVEEELNALLKPEPTKRLPIGRMHADEEEEKIQAVRYVNVTLAQLIITSRSAGRDCCCAVVVDKLTRKLSARISRDQTRETSGG